MKYIGVFLLFYILTTISTSQANVIKGQQWTYSYKGQIDAFSSACNRSFARWTMSGIIVGQSFDSYMVFKLEDLKTSLFNGDIDDLKFSKEKSIPSKAEILTKPFVIHKNNDGFTIDVTPNEPLWSINMKRSIGSHFQINFERGFDGEFIEHSLYGDCSINYISDKIEKDIIVNKIINHDKCKNSPFSHYTNVKKAEPMKNYNPLKIETVKKYILKESNSILFVSDTYSISNITYKPMPIIPYTQNINQYQEFKMLTHTKIDKLINIEESNEKHNITYEIDMESILDNGRKKIQKPDEQINELIANYENLETEFNQTLKHFTMSKEDYIDNMVNLLIDMKTDTFSKLNEVIKERDDLFNITILSLLPYINTNDGTNYIIDLLQNHFNFEGSEYLGVKFLSTFPKYIEEPTEEIVKKFEFLLELNTNEILKDAAILSFSNIVQRAINKETLSNKKIEEYKNMFYNKFKNEDIYQSRMTYLLSLVNIGEILDVNFIIEMLANTSENKHLRALGITGFKHRLIHKSEMTFDKFWPIVQNETEPFDVRVAALDLLLSSNLSRDQFYKIVDVYKNKQKGINNKHLLHYFQTSMITLQNTTRFTDPLGALATELLQNDEFPEFRLNAHAWTTSKYRFAYTDKESNFGRNIEGNIIANPMTNSINSLQFTYNYFTMSFDMGTYTVYLKFNDVFESTYIESAIHQLKKTDLTITNLLDLIKEFNFKMKSEDLDFHLEIVVFIDYKAIVSVHMHQKNARTVQELIINGISLTEHQQEMRVSYPLIDYIGFPSDLGTTLTLKNDIQDVFAGEHPRRSLDIREYWYHQIWFEAYNPMVGSAIGSYKYYGYEYTINNMLIDFTPYRKTFSFYHQNDSLQFIYDKIIGTSAGKEEVLKTYCSECENYYEISNDDWFKERYMDLEYLSLLINVTRGKHIVFTNTSDAYISNLVDSHYSNGDSLTVSKPLLLFWNFIEHENYFQNELTRGSFRSIPYFQDQTMSLLKFIDNKKENMDRRKIMHADNYNNFTLEFSSYSVYDDDVKLHWVSSFSHEIIIKNIDDIDKPKIPELHINFDFDCIVYNESRFKVSLERNVIFPKLNEDKFSIQPAGPAVGGAILRFCNLPEEASGCSTTDTPSLVLKEKFWLSDERKNSILKTDDYKTCEKEKKGLEFTPPTKACVLDSYIPLHQYDNYEMYVGYYNGSDKQEFATPTITYSIPSPSKMKLALLKNYWTIGDFDFDPDPGQYWNKTINFWGLYANPSAFAYYDYDTIIGIKRSCIISPNQIKTLNGDILDFDKSKPVALVECLKKPLRGLTIQKIDAKHIGFNLWTLNNTVTATLVDGHLQISLNGNEIKSTYFDETNNFKITFIGKNVILIEEKEIQIYYNTEYLFTKMGSMYSSTLCGFCANNNN